MIFSGSSQALSGTGTILLQNQLGNALVLASNNASLTIGPGITIHGGSNSTTSAQIGASPFFTSGSGLSIINQGTINADSPATQLTINPGGGTLTNSGVLIASAGGTLALNGLVDNGGSTIVNAGVLNLGGSLTQSALGR